MALVFHAERYRYRLLDPGLEDRDSLAASATRIISAAREDRSELLIIISPRRVCRDIYA